MNENYLVEEVSACEESVTEPLVSELRKKKKSKLQKAREGKVFKWVNGALMALFALFCLYPFVNVVLTSFASFGDYVNSNGLVIPYHLLSALTVICSVSAGSPKDSSLPSASPSSGRSSTW